MSYFLRPMESDDRNSVIEIFNYYIEHSFAAYRSQKVSEDFFENFFTTKKIGFPAMILDFQKDSVAGFGLLRPYKEIPEFSQTAEITYFLHPDHRGKGGGSKMLTALEERGRDIGVRILLASITSKNEASLKFHSRKGFHECGRFKGIGQKNGEPFDVVWMQKML